MTTAPKTPSPATGWDQATFRCGRCGAIRTATNEDAYHQVVGAHRDAHAVWDRLNPTERDGLASILRVVLAAPELGAEFLALIDHQERLTAPPTRPNDPHDEPQKGDAA
ncbi:hypothetical protein [Streptomyces colonosanans]|uniref:hypothetical protein n=1 Tax=Streptomyces colonosanans TaxID=1428652 RepID=UPI001FE6532E|nr:hypothetical protein [Streptomyces colonosanans]